MKTTQLIEALNQLDDKYYMEPLNYHKPKKNRTWVKWVASAACLCLALLGLIAAIRSLQSNPVSHNTLTSSKDGITIPRLEMSLSSSDGASADMIGFFIYDGRTYVYNETLPHNLNLIDQFLFTAQGLIDEWTPKDGYVEFAGSIHGDVYSVRGIRPEFLLCMRLSDGSIQTFMNNNGITIQQGSDILEQGFHLQTDFTGLNFQTAEAWFNSTGELYTLKAEHRDIITSLIDALNTSKFYVFDKPYPPQGEPQYHLFFSLTNGISIHLRTYADGYISIDGIRDCYLKIEASLYNEIIALFESTEACTPIPAPSFAPDYQDCLDEATLGPYLPTFQPSDMNFREAHMYYHINQQTGELISIKEMHLTFAGENSEYHLMISYLNDYTENTDLYPLYDLATLTLEDIQASTTEYPENTKPVVTRISVRINDKIVQLSAHDLGAEKSFQLLTSINQ